MSKALEFAETARLRPKKQFGRLSFQVNDDGSLHVQVLNGQATRLEVAEVIEFGKWVTELYGESET